ncbi:hypothetical protein B296_00038345 [Ensete ventricosum]|uniref:Uncharacterized protein n=1 Tax=Ensete ventricosum TaxID=4639 RepID=A0A426YZ14_ENSVE|nr:hypothetical protein B296_00038345 [Ensete ventricosum]
MKGFRCTKLWLDIADEANTLGEEDEDGSLEHGARQREVSIETEVVNHVDEEENRKVEEGADGKGEKESCDVEISSIREESSRDDPQEERWRSRIYCTDMLSFDSEREREFSFNLALYRRGVDREVAIAAAARGRTCWGLAVF